LQPLVFTILFAYRPTIILCADRSCNIKHHGKWWYSRSLNMGVIYVMTLNDLQRFHVIKYVIKYLLQTLMVQMIIVFCIDAVFLVALFVLTQFFWSQCFVVSNAVILKRFPSFLIFWFAHLFIWLLIFFSNVSTTIDPFWDISLDLGPPDSEAGNSSFCYHCNFILLFVSFYFISL